MVCLSGERLRLFRETLCFDAGCRFSLLEVGWQSGHPCDVPVVPRDSCALPGAKGTALGGGILGHPELTWPCTGLLAMPP